MDFAIIFTVLLATVVFALCASGEKAFKFIISALVGLVLSALIVYFFMPALTLVGIVVFVSLFAVFGGLIGLTDDYGGYNSRGHKESENSLGRTISVIGAFGGSALLVITILAGVFAVPLSADQLYSLPQVTVHPELNTTLVSSDHIREVSQKTAIWRSDKVIGNLGDRVEVGSMNIQTVNGSLVWLASLDYNGFWKAYSYGSEGTEGYTIVNAEDSKAQVILVSNVSMRYTDNAVFGYSLQRDIYVDYPGYYMGQHTFQLDDKGSPKWVTMVSDPAALGIVGDIPRGVIITDPVTGHNDFYTLGTVPGWVQRVMDEGVTEKYLGYWGAYKHGFWNTVFGQRDYLVPTGGLDVSEGSGGAVSVSQSASADVYMIRGTDGRLYWFGSFTTIGKDSSMVGYMLVDLKTGKFDFYPTMAFYNDIGASKNVQQNPEVAKVMGARVTQPILYMINGQEMWIMPVITKSGENIMMGIVRAKTGETFVAPDLKSVLAKVNGDTTVTAILPDGSNTSIDGIISNLTKDLDQLRQYRDAQGNATA